MQIRAAKSAALNYLLISRQYNFDSIPSIAWNCTTSSVDTSAYLEPVGKAINIKTDVPNRVRRSVPSRSAKRSICQKRVSIGNERFQNHTGEKLPLLPVCSTSVQDLLRGLSSEGTVVRPDERLLPPWLHLELAIKGQQFAMDHMISIACSYVFGLTILLAIPEIRDVLLFTHNSDSEDAAAKRYASTIVQVFLWLRRAMEASEVSETNWVLESIRNVRFIHRHVAVKMNGQNNHTINETLLPPVNEALWKAFQNDLDTSWIPQEQRQMPHPLLEEDSITVPMNQFGFSMTQFAFVGLGVIRPRELYLGRAVNDKDFEAYAHFWAVMGHALGMEDEFNVALQPDVPALKEYLEETLQTYYIPALFNLSHGSKVLIEYWLDGATQIFTGLDPEMILRQVLKQILRIRTPHLDARRTPLGLKYDLVWSGARGPATIFPQWIPISSPLASLYHFKVGFQFFGQKYSSDESIAKNCFYYK